MEPIDIQKRTGLDMTYLHQHSVDFQSTFKQPWNYIYEPDNSKC